MSIKVITGKVRASFVHVFEPQSINGSEPKYSCSLIIPKSDTVTVGKIREAIEQAKQEGVPKWGGKIPPNLKLPLRDGDVDRPEDPAYAETVVLLSKGEIDSKKVRVEFSLEDMDMSGFQKGATYEQIKAYVLEHTGLKVSSLYISQIKRKCGLDVGQNYNLSKKEDAKVPKCPPEKEAAIRDALKYFQMI